MTKKILLTGFSAALLLVGAGCSSNNKFTMGDTALPEAQKDTVAAMPTTSVVDKPVVSGTIPKSSSSESKTTFSAGGANQSAPKSYTDALAIYRTSGYYFQFVNCHGNPGSLTIKRGVKYMMDNRDAKSHRIAVGSNIYTLGAYGYAIATAPSTVGTYYVTCDGGGAAKILVQK